MSLRPQTTIADLPQPLPIIIYKRERSFFFLLFSFVLCEVENIFNDILVLPKALSRNQNYAAAMVLSVSDSLAVSLFALFSKSRKGPNFSILFTLRATPEKETVISNC